METSIARAGGDTGALERVTTYLLPIKASKLENMHELTGYLHALSTFVDLVIVDGSGPAIFAEHASAWGEIEKHLAPDPSIRGLNGKVRGVLTGLKEISTGKIIIADDDVRYDEHSLKSVIRALDFCDVVRPQNYFMPHAWHTLLDTGRILLNRVSGGDWPGTLGVRRDAIAQGYNADVLFENFELVEAIKGRGGREHVAYGIFVRRLPPSPQHFFSQRVRQAYDEFSRPLRLVAALSLLPVMIGLIAARRPQVVLAGAFACVAAAEAGRRRANAAQHFPVLASLVAPLWVLERAVCAWVAVGMRLRYGGVPYAGSVIRNAATAKRKGHRRPA